MNDLALKIIESRKALQSQYGKLAMPLDRAYPVDFTEDVIASLQRMNNHLIAVQREIEDITDKYNVLHVMV